VRLALTAAFFLIEFLYRGEGSWGNQARFCPPAIICQLVRSGNARGNLTHPQCLPLVPMLQLQQFRKTYQRRLVLHIEDFTLPPAVYWLRGSNGSGKSTLLKSLAGIIPYQGDIILEGRWNLRQHAVAYRSAVNFAEAEPIFPTFLTGVELIRLFKAAKKAPAHQEAFYLESMQLSAYVHEPVHTYSSGMLKKLALVLAFLGQPRCILLDEPLTTLDAESLPILYAWITQQHQQHGTLFLLSSHQAFAGGTLPPVQELLVAQQTLQHYRA